MPWLQWSRESHRAASADVLTELTENGIHPSLGIRASICVMSVCLPFLFLRLCWWKKRAPPLLPSRCTTRAFSGAVRFRWSPRRTQSWPLSSVRRRSFPLVKLHKVFVGSCPMWLRVPCSTLRSPWHANKCRKEKCPYVTVNVKDC